MAEKQKAEAPEKVPERYRVRCRQTGFEAVIPAADWNAYTKEQRAAYRVLGEE